MNTSSVLATKVDSQTVLSCYQNETPHIQVARLFEDSRLCLERIIFPGEQFLFEASAEADLEICSQDSTGTLLSRRIRCLSLQVKS